MSDLSGIEKLKLEKLFGMESGYVMSFSNRTFEEFFLENASINIFQSKYDYASGSKANRLRALWLKENNNLIGKLMVKLLEYWKLQKELNNQVITLEEKSLYDQCLQISERLLQNSPTQDKTQHDLEERKKKEQEVGRENKIKLLCKTFEELAKSNEPQKRGFLLQGLLNQMFLVYEIPVRKSFQRNDGGEQIDGAFSFQGWHYLVECKWTKKLADIRELDSLLGKVIRSGKQAMGLFISIEGWSINVPQLLKQNPEKAIILMDGYDIRCVLNKDIELDVMLQEKITKLNLESEPFYSVSDMLKRQYESE